MLTEPEFIDSELKKSIAEAVHEFAKHKKLEGIKSLSQTQSPKGGTNPLLVFTGSEPEPDGEEISSVPRHHQTHAN